MWSNFIHLKLIDKNNINQNNKELFGLLKISMGNDVHYLGYKKKYSNLNFIISYYKIFIKKNIGKMKYTTNKNKVIKLFDKTFLHKNIKRAKMIINNKLYNLEEIFVREMKKVVKIRIHFLDIIICLNYMFKNCEALSSVYNLQYFNTKYLKKIYGLFYGCSSLSFIDGIFNWNISKINDISKLFYDCSSLKCLPDNVNSLLNPNHIILKIMFPNFQKYHNFIFIISKKSPRALFKINPFPFKRLTQIS